MENTVKYSEGLFVFCPNSLKFLGCLIEVNDIKPDLYRLYSILGVFSPRNLRKIHL